MINVDRNTPELQLPKKRTVHATKYPFNKMAIGTSFFIPCEQNQMTILRNSIYISAKRYNVKANADIHISIAKVKGGLRVWRVPKNYRQVIKYNCTIEHGIPYRVRNHYPFGKMSVGDSFAVELREGQTYKQLRANLQFSVKAYNKHNGLIIGILSKQIPDTNTVRVWRII